MKALLKFHLPGIRRAAWFGPGLALLAALILAPALSRAVTADCNGLANCVEAESGARAGTWVTGTQGGGTYITSQGAANCNQTSPGNDGARIPFTVSVCGHYNFQLGVRNNGGTSFYFEVLTSGGAPVADSAGNGLRRYNINANNGWASETLADNTGTGGIRYWDLAPGSYLLHVTGRSCNANLGWIQVVNNGSAPNAVCSATRTFSPGPSATPTPVPADGLQGKYYDNQDFTNLMMTRIDAPIDFNWGAGSPNPSMGNTTYSIRWTGCFLDGAAGTYTFYCSNDDGVRLWIGSTLVVDDWVDQSVNETSNTIMLSSASTWYPIRLDYYQNGGVAECHLSYSGPGIAKQIIPRGKLAFSSCPIYTPSPTPTNIINSPTFTPTPLSYYEGLTQTCQLYNREYIPFPALTTTPEGNPVFYDLSYPFTTAAAAAVPKNTARFRVVLTGVSLTVGSGEVSCETRLGTLGENCDTGFYYLPVSVDASTITSLPAVIRPANLSTTYFWFAGDTVSANVPPTEMFDAVGDPRFTPYYDELGNATNPNTVNNYNWFFKNMADTTQSDYHVQYANFLPLASFPGYNTANSDYVHFDVPKLFRLVREGVLESRSIYTSVTGWNSYYAGLGGEFGGDASNALSNNGVPVESAAWDGGTALKYADEILQNKSLIRSTDSKWRCLPWLGELWPDASYDANWASYVPSTSTYPALYGNLPNSGFRRDIWSNCDDAGGTAPWTLVDGKSRNQRFGCATMLNATNDGASTYDHSGLGTAYAAVLLYDGQQMGDQFLMPMPSSFGVTRPWDINLNDNVPQEWNLSPYKDPGARFHMDIYSASSQPANVLGYYSYNGTNTDQRGSAAMRVEDSTNQRAGWFIINGFAPAGTAGTNFVARFAILSCMRTFLDAGAPVSANTYLTVNYNIQPVPLVQIYEPDLSATFDKLQNIKFSWNLSWLRWDGQKYTENYPTGVTFSTQVVFNLKWADPQGNYYFCDDNTPTQPGVYVDAYANTNLTYTWNVAGLGASNKVFRVEAYRVSVYQHYAYHEFNLYTNP